MEMNADTLRISIAPREEPKVDGSLGIVDLLLRDRRAFFEHLERSSDLASIARALLLTVLAGCAVFGASMGAYRGGLQLLFSAVKLPLVVLLTAGVCAPALTGLLRSVNAESRFTRDLLLVLSALALGSMVLAALAPIVVLAELAGTGYHGLIVLIVGCCLIAGTCGLALFVGGLRRRKSTGLGIVVPLALAVFALVGTQMAWTFRPYVLRPRTQEVPFMRALEGGFLDSVKRSTDSARGVYRREAAPLPGEE
jgi:hypothetical protein